MEFYVIASLLTQLSYGFLSAVLNNSLKRYGDVYISAIGIYNRIIPFIMYPMFGIRQGVQPIIGFNYGAKNFKRVKECLKFGVFLSISRQVIFLIPLIIILPMFWKFTGIYAAIPISDVLSAVITSIFIFIEFKRMGESKNSKAIA